MKLARWMVFRTPPSAATLSEDNPGYRETRTGRERYRPLGG
jgi:hypothetical protein